MNALLLLLSGSHGVSRNARFAFQRAARRLGELGEQFVRRPFFDEHRHPREFGTSSPRRSECRPTNCGTTYEFTSEFHHLAASSVSFLNYFSLATTPLKNARKGALRIRICIKDRRGGSCRRESHHVLIADTRLPREFTQCAIRSHTVVISGFD